MDVFLGVFSVSEANRIKAQLENEGVIIEQRYNEQTCTTGCTVTLEVWGKESDMEALQSFFQKERQRDTAGLDINPDLINEVFDPNADEVTCQACGFKFKPNVDECPDCGLFYG